MTAISMLKFGQTDAEAAMLKLGDGLPLIPLDMIKDVEWQRRWAVAQSKRETAEGQSSTIKALLQEARELLGADFLIRAAQKNPLTWGVGHVEHGATFRSLREAADEEADKEKKKEGVKDRAGKERVRVVE